VLDSHKIGWLPGLQACIIEHLNLFMVYFKSIYRSESFASLYHHGKNEP